MAPNCRILVGDCREVLRDFPDKSVHCCVTSPPYWGLRSYEGGAGMIGLEPTFDEHLSNLVDVFREVRRVLRDDGVMFLNYADAYAHSTKGKGGDGKQTTNAGSMLQDRRATIPRGLKPKDLMMMPSRVAMALQAPHLQCHGCLHVAHESRWGRWPHGRRICPGCETSKGADVETPGWWLRSEIIWHKPNPMPESVTDRPTNAHEKLFLLTKSARYFYDAEAVSESATCDRTRGPALHPDLVSTNGNAGLSRRDSGGTRNLRNVWTIPTYSFKEAHFATFPPALVKPCIKAGTSQRGVCGECGAPWKRQVERCKPNRRSDAIADKENKGWLSRAGDPTSTTTGWAPTCEHKAAIVPATVLDPFAGSGTVGHVALSLGRKFIGIEISAEYTDMALRRVMGPLFAETGGGDV